MIRVTLSRNSSRRRSWMESASSLEAEHTLPTGDHAIDMAITIAIRLKGSPSHTNPRRWASDGRQPNEIGPP
jgi:hypothetical protein